MDALCNGVKKPEGADPAVDPRPPPAKLARLEQNGAGPSAQEQGSQGSPGAKNPCVAPKAPLSRPQGRSLHGRGGRRLLREAAGIGGVAVMGLLLRLIQGARCPSSAWWSTRRALWRGRKWRSTPSSS